MKELVSFSGLTRQKLAVWICKIRHSDSCESLKCPYLYELNVISKAEKYLWQDVLH